MELGTEAVFAQAVERVTPRMRCDKCRGAMRVEWGRRPFDVCWICDDCQRLSAIYDKALFLAMESEPSH